jgi:hypothetical protein
MRALVEGHPLPCSLSVYAGQEADVSQLLPDNFCDDEWGILSPCRPSLARAGCRPGATGRLESPDRAYDPRCGVPDRRNQCPR